ncbi:MAG: thioredoxin family protein [Taibaiella sp.]|jgi:thiamine biosynthesis lipoprotein
MLKHILVSLFFCTPFLVNAQVTHDPNEAFTWATSTNRPILLVFEGSDWCLPCIKLDRKVLSTDIFIHFANESLVVLKADFPQKKKLDPLLAKQYERLAEIYNKEGAFPKMILITPDQKELGTIKANYGKPEQLIEKLQQELKLYHEKI